jgi:hypothetical protein
MAASGASAWDWAQLAILFLGYSSDKFYHRYHSLRYVDDTLVIRIKSPITPRQVEHLKTAFKDLLKPEGKIYLSKPLVEEFDEPEILHLNRLIIDFNRKDYGRLRELIDTLNDFD